MAGQRRKIDGTRYALQAVAGLVVLALFLARAAYQVPLAEALANPELLTLAATGLVLALALPALRPLEASVLTLVAVAPAVYLGVTRPPSGALVPMEHALLAILALFALKILVSYVLETHDRQQLAARFGQYVPTQVAQALAEDPDVFSMDGEAREMTVMFADIRDFTAIAERLEPRELVKLLNDVFTPLTEVVHRHGGTIDKYIGDALMAFWGAPLRDPEHAQRAVLAAVEMQAALARLRGDLARRGGPAVEMGIGLNTGTMSVGNMGSRYRVAYTVVGDPVNLAARVQALTREIRADVLVTEAVREHAPALLYREIGTLRVRGKAEGFRLFQPIGRKEALTPELAAWLADHEQALASFYARRWDEAVTRFGRLWAQHPEDRLYELYLNNLRVFTRGPTPTGWSGELDPDAPEGFGLPPVRRAS
jgi:adenylate cyclase